MINKKILTKKEMAESNKERLALIQEEFEKGFGLLRHFKKSVTFFGSSRTEEAENEYALAKTLGQRIVSELGYSVITGGGPGIMEAANRGAFEAKGQSIGLTIDMPEAQVTNGYLTQHLDFHHLFSRKVCLTFTSEALVFFPGGLGTMDEFFEIITLLQTNKIERVPIITIGSEYWNKVKKFMEDVLMAGGYIDPDDTKIFTITDDLDQAIEIIKNAPSNNGRRLEA